MRAIVTGFLVLSAAVAGCKKDAKEGGAEESSADPASVGEGESPAPSREPTTTENHQLGTVPEGKGLDIATSVPEVAVTDLEGEEVALPDLVRRGPTLIVFYRGGWCPYCNAQVRRMTEAYPELEKRGVTPALISVDRPEAAAQTRASYEIPFPVLSDPDLEAHRAFRVVHQASDKERAALREAGVDLEAASGKSHHSYAIPSMFLFGEDGKLVWRHVDPDYTVRPSMDQVLRILDANGFAPE